MGVVVHPHNHIFESTHIGCITGYNSRTTSVLEYYVLICFKYSAEYRTQHTCIAVNYIQRVQK